jgi:hypothetical protein
MAELTATLVIFLGIDILVFGRRMVRKSPGLLRQVRELRSTRIVVSRLNLINYINSKFRIRIDFMRIQIRIQHFSNSGSRSGSRDLMTKN